MSYLDPAAAWAKDVGATAGSARLRAFLAARVSLRYDDSAADVDEQEEFEAVYGPLDGGLDLASETQVDYEDRDFSTAPPAGAVFVLPQAPVAEAKFFTQTAKDIQRHLVERRPLELQRNRALKLVSRPGESADDFAKRCDAAAQERADAEAAKIRDRLEAKRDRLDKALAQAQRRVEELDTDTRTRQANELISGAGAVLGALFGGRRSTRSMASAIGGAASRRGMTARTSERKQTAEQKVDATKDDLAELEQEILDEVAEIDERWKATAARGRHADDPARGDRRPRARDAARVGAERLIRIALVAVLAAVLHRVPGRRTRRRRRPPPTSDVVEWVNDGDTLTLDGGGKVRLLQIDAPELTDRLLRPRCADGTGTPLCAEGNAGAARPRPRARPDRIAMAACSATSS